jgi:hypothetical protein
MYRGGIPRILFSLLRGQIIELAFDLKRDQYLLPCCLLFLNAISGQRRESPIFGESEKRFSSFDRVGKTALKQLLNKLNA